MSKIIIFRWAVLLTPKSLLFRIWFSVFAVRCVCGCLRDYIYISFAFSDQELTDTGFDKKNIGYFVHNIIKRIYFISCLSKFAFEKIPKIKGLLFIAIFVLACRGIIYFSLVSTPAPSPFVCSIEARKLCGWPSTSFFGSSLGAPLSSPDPHWEGKETRDVRLLWHRFKMGIASSSSNVAFSASDLIYRDTVRKNSHIFISRLLFYWCRV